MDSLYRAAALSHRSRLWNGRALLARGLPALVHLALTALFFIVLAMFLCIGSYTRRVTVSGELASLPGPVRVTAPGQGFIISRLVSAGDKVKKGSLFMKLTSAIRRDPAWSAFSSGRIRRPR